MSPLRGREQREVGGAVPDRRIRVVHDDRAAFLQGLPDQLRLAALGPAVVPESVLADQAVRGRVVDPVEGALVRALETDLQGIMYRLAGRSSM
jgi:hypothetical protein